MGSEFRNTAIARANNIRNGLIMVGLTVAMIAANVYYFAQAI